jgi:hypothetical protein
MTIQEILARPPEELEAMSDTELFHLLEQFIPATRLALLPPEKPRKLGVEMRAIKDAIGANKEDILKTLEELKKRGG